MRFTRGAQTHMSQRMCIADEPIAWPQCILEISGEPPFESSGHPNFPSLQRPDLSGSSAHPCPGSSGVEQWTENPRVGGSIPPPGTT